MDREPKAGATQLLPPVRYASDDSKNLTTIDSVGNIITSSTVTKDMTFQGTANTFAQGSINSTAIGPLQLVTFPQASPTITAADAGKVLVATTSTRTINLPNNAAIPAGMVFEVVNNTNTGAFCYIQAAAGVSLFYNSAIGGSGDGSLGGGVAARVRLRGPMTSARVVKIDNTTWWVFGDMVAA